MSAAWARSCSGCSPEIADSQIRARAASADSISAGLTYRWCASASANAAQTSVQWSASAGLQLLLGGDEQLGVGAEQVEQRAEALDRQQLGDVRRSD